MIRTKINCTGILIIKSPSHIDITPLLFSVIISNNRSMRTRTIVSKLIQPLNSLISIIDYLLTSPRYTTYQRYDIIFRLCIISGLLQTTCHKKRHDKNERYKNPFFHQRKNLKFAIRGAFKLVVSKFHSA